MVHVEPAFLSADAMDSLAAAVEEADALAGEFECFPLIYHASYREGRRLEGRAEVKDGYRRLHSILDAVAAVSDRLAEVGRRKCPDLVDVPLRAITYLMGLQLLPQGTGPSGWHRDQHLRYVGLVLVSDPNAFTGGRLTVQELRHGEIVWGPSTLNRGELLLFNDEVYQHHRSSCFGAGGRRLILNMKIGPAAWADSAPFLKGM